jgi:hypothetical protein
VRAKNATAIEKTPVRLAALVEAEPASSRRATHTSQRHR